MRLSFAIRLTTLYTAGWNPRPFPFGYRLVRQQTTASKGRFYSGTSVTLASSSIEEDDLLRWERMYAEGMQSSGAGLSIEPSEDVSIRSKVYIVTYDLDNTLWNTSATISAANDALAAHMEGLCSKVATNATAPRVEKHMKALHHANPENYGPTVATSSRAKAPVRLTALRKEAIRRVLIEEAGYTDEDEQLESAVESAFSVWANARHTSIPGHFAASGVLESLQAIRESTDVVAIGAITDGNSDPMAIPVLQGYFDFCINAEQVGIGKPDRRVYQRAVEHVIEQFPWLRSKILAWSEDDENTIDTVGPWWVHVGDDFVKDVVAAKNFGMRSIWSRELVLDKIQAQSLTTERRPNRDLESFVKEISSMDVIEMQIGADDYLAESLQKEFADAIVDRFLDVAKTIKQWQTHAEEKPLDITSIELKASETTTQTQTETTSVTEELGSKSTKFCLFCGTKLPATAKFCSSCGKEQI